MWARKGVGVTECPRSYITPESVAMVEEFWAWRALGRLPEGARQVEALIILQGEWEQEGRDG